LTGFYTQPPIVLSGLCNIRWLCAVSILLESIWYTLNIGRDLCSLRAENTTGARLILKNGFNGNDVELSPRAGEQETDIDLAAIFFIESCCPERPVN
jgi:hypothetical protein